jgi:hypothetical protein
MQAQTDDSGAVLLFRPLGDKDESPLVLQAWPHGADEEMAAAGDAPPPDLPPADEVSTCEGLPGTCVHICVHTHKKHVYGH